MFMATLTSQALLLMLPSVVRIHVMNLLMAGLKVALVERDDFASETSSRSTKLIHGGGSSPFPL
jgi:hypothetical protein